MGLLKTMMGIVWLLDICNIAGFEFLDTTYAVNGLFWTLYILFIGFVTVNKE